MSIMVNADRSEQARTKGKFCPVGNTISRAAGAAVVVRSTPWSVIGPEESNGAHNGALGSRTVDLCTSGHGHRGESRDCGGETHLEEHWDAGR